MAEAGKNFDLGDPGLKGAAVRDVLGYVAKIQDPVERVEVAKSVADGFKVPEGAVFEELKLKPRRPDLQPVSRPLVSRTSKKLLDDEKQLIQALVQNPAHSELVKEWSDMDFWHEVWSWPVVAGLLQNPKGIEQVLEGIEDSELIDEVRQTYDETPAPFTQRQVVSFMANLRDSHLVKQLKQVQEQVSGYGAAGAPAELLLKKTEITLERNRIKESCRALENKGVRPML
jgi:hypothetical protein